MAFVATAPSYFPLNRYREICNFVLFAGLSRCTLYAVIVSCSFAASDANRKIPPLSTAPDADIVIIVSKTPPLNVKPFKIALDEARELVSRDPSENVIGYTAADVYKAKQSWSHS